MSGAETWLPVAGFEGLYEVSDLGRARSTHSGAVKIKTPSSSPDGYPILVLYGRGKPKGIALHRAVALAFHTNGQNALHREVGHLDGNRANARADNLKWVSKVENHFHRRAHGTHPAGEKHPRAKLTELQAIEIKSSRKPMAEIAAAFGVSRYTVSDIRRGKRWPHLQSLSQGEK